MGTASTSNLSRLLVAIRCLVWTFAGIVAAECFVRLVVPFPIYYDTWFEAGIHRQDDELGFVYAPNYIGGMRHRDRTWRVELKLDGNGFRLPISTQGAVIGPASDVVLLGGRSMMFSYGLPDDRTIAASIARDAAMPVTVHTLSQPGFDLARDFYKYKRFLDGQISPSVVVLSLYTIGDYDSLLAEYSPRPPKRADNLFRFHDSIVISRPGLAERLGRPFFQSYVIAGGCRMIDELHQRLSQAGVSAEAPTAALPSSGQSNAGGTTERPPGNDLLSTMHRYFELRGAKLIIVALPVDLVHRPGNKQAISRLKNHVGASGLSLIDLSDSLPVASSDWKASGHYGPKSAQIVGQRIANAIEPLLKSTE